MVPPFFSVSIARQPCNNPRDPHRLPTDKLLCFICGNKIAFYYKSNHPPPQPPLTHHNNVLDGMGPPPGPLLPLPPSFSPTGCSPPPLSWTSISEVYFNCPSPHTITHSHPQRDSKWPCIPCVINVNNQAKFPVRVCCCVCLEQQWWS